MVRCRPLSTSTRYDGIGDLPIRGHQRQRAIQMTRGPVWPTVAVGCARSGRHAVVQLAAVRGIASGSAHRRRQASDRPHATGDRPDWPLRTRNSRPGKRAGVGRCWVLGYMSWPSWMVVSDNLYVELWRAWSTRGLLLAHRVTLGYVGRT